MHRKVHIVALVAALALLLVLTAGCGGRNRETAAAAAPLGVRTPQPTFTPTPIGTAPVALQPIATIAPVLMAGTEAAAPTPAPDAAPAIAAVPTQPGFGGPVTPPAPLAGPPPLGIVNSELVNSRSGPDTSFPVVVVLGRGEEFDVTGKNAEGNWWRICCVDDKDVWTSAEFLDVAESTANVPVAQAGEVSAAALVRLNAPAAAADASAPAVAAAPTATPEPAPAPAVVEVQPPAEPAVHVAAAGSEVVSVAAENTGDGNHTLVAFERFPETNVVRAFLYVYSGSEALAGYSLRVTKDGVEQTVAGESFGGMAGLTWPMAGDRQRFQNFKVEFPSVAPAGTWTVELVKDGAVVGSTATFTLSDNDPDRELYVRYERR